MGEPASRRIEVTGTAPPEWRSALDARLVGAGHQLVGTADVPDVVIVLELDPAAIDPIAFTGTDEAAWERWAEAPARRTIPILQAAYERSVAGSGGLVVLVQPATALEGSAGLVAATTGWEAQRTLVKSAARRWGAAGFRAAIVLVAPDSIGGPPADALRTPRSVPSIASDIAAAHEAVLLVLRPEAAVLNGETVTVDGGALMLP